MDTKKLFEYEFMLESMKPELTEAEVLSTTKAAETQGNSLENIVSFNITAGEGGLFVKFIDSKGEQKKMVFLNPVAAKSLASNLLHNLSEAGYVEEDIIELDDVDTQTLH